MFFYDLVDNEHGRLAQRCCRHGRHHSRPRFMQPETKTKSSPSVREKKREHRTKARTFASAANGGEVGDEGVESLEDLELFVDTLRNAVVHCLDDGQDLREGDWAQGDVTGTHVEVFVSVEEDASAQGHPTS